jgi:uncharacterized glyoxalase superfamily protein PhnB
MTHIVPNLHYRDPQAALQWLATAFGFEEVMVVRSDAGEIAHAELRFGDGYLFVGGPGRDGLAMGSPRDLGGTSVDLCLYVREVDAHYARAVAAGAEVVYPVADTSYGSRGYTVRDPEGHLWTFGTYRPGQTG